MNEQEAREFIRMNRRGVLATIRRDGRPQLSNLVFTLDDDGVIRLSTTRDRAKARNIQRDPRVALSVQGPSFDYVVVEGTARLQEENLAAELRRIYERIAGKPHPDWAEFDEAMIEENRVVMAITVDRLYPLTE